MTDLAYYQKLKDSYHESRQRDNGHHRLNACVIGIGDFGRAIEDKIHERVQQYKDLKFKDSPYFLNGFDVFIYDDHAAGIWLPEKFYPLIFITGSIEDRNFKSARNFARSLQAAFVMMITDSPGTVRGPLPDGNLLPNEALVFVEGNDAEDIALDIIHDTFTASAGQLLVCMDLSDIIYVLGGSRCLGFSKEGSAGDVLNLIKDNSLKIKNGKGIVFILSYDYQKDFGLADFDPFLTAIDDCGSDNFELAWTVPYHHQRIGKGQRGTLIIAL